MLKPPPKNRVKSLDTVPSYICNVDSLSLAYMPAGCLELGYSFRIFSMLS